jgi:hypothetical protein
VFSACLRIIPLKMSQKRTAKSIFIDLGKGCNSGQVFAREVSITYVVRLRLQNFKLRAITLC